ncbi:TIGR03620 family F420-dependent LLM class oxidoreductase [Streptomyces luomodiensis]|uniref:TIGR03620 family F420-dependent LLM class oxidoreductase n=1 Tax=Streptomyces luomodiensis TaxID=3026192 RepID=A0ABY9V8X1_9ACTN|nr:TIGR03620 family F420-dependent LLM class oxidoreductase [Streptomyces sp. SCA4-21]WNF01067.1 TIGR03620 family F420-dependent LLM class oxidoreductase [Streptomyces sp. SCA4-21]
MTAARELAARIGPVGVWPAVLGEVPAARAAAAAAEIEDLGYGALWIGESPAHKEVFTHSALLLGATSRITVATGVATIGARDATATDAAAQTLGEAFPDRFVLGLGAGHAEAGRGRGHDRPLTALREYLDALDTRPYRGPRPARPVPRVLAALRPRMQELARDRTSGAHSFFVPPSHTAAARERLGPDPLLAPEQAVVVDPDPGRARAIARAHVATRLALRNYVNHVRALGFGDDDLVGSGSDRLVDALVAWGDPETVAARVREHLDAGADHVAIHPLTAAPAQGLAPVLDQLRALTPALPLTTVLPGSAR